MAKIYSAPKLTKLGSFEEVTKGNAGGRRLDKTFPVNTDFGNLTFS